MKSIFPILFGLACLATISVQAQSFDQAVGTVDRDLSAALEELKQLNQQIAEEKLPLAKRVTTLENSVAEKREEIRQLRREGAEEASSLRSLEDDVRKQEEKIDSLGDQLDDFTRLFEARIHISELPQYRSIIDVSLNFEGQDEATSAQQLSAQLDLVEASIGRVQGLLGGAQFEGKALASDGTLEAGKFSLLGPITLFASKDSGESGFARQEANAMDPALQVVPEAHRAGVRGIVESGSGTLPLDITDGEAFQVASTEETLAQHLTRGGVVMIPILLLAVLATVVAIWKSIELSRAKPIRPAQVQELLDLVHEEKVSEAKERAAAIGGPGGQLLREAVEHVRTSKELLEEVLLEQILHQLLVTAHDLGEEVSAVEEHQDLL